jgi:hypothetical protein
MRNCDNDGQSTKTIVECETKQAKQNLEQRRELIEADVVVQQPNIVSPTTIIKQSKIILLLHYPKKKKKKKKNVSKVMEKIHVRRREYVVLDHRAIEHCRAVGEARHLVRLQRLGERFDLALRDDPILMRMCVWVTRRLGRCLSAVAWASFVDYQIHFFQY